MEHEYLLACSRWKSNNRTKSVNDIVKPCKGAKGRLHHKFTIVQNIGISYWLLCSSLCLTITFYWQLQKDGTICKVKKKVHQAVSKMHKHPKFYLTWEDWIMWCERASAPWVQITMTTNFLDKRFIYFHLKWLANSPTKTLNRKPNWL